MATSTWTAGDADPAGTINSSLLDDAIRTLRKDTRERLLQGGHKFAGDTSRSGSNENNDGKHVVGIDDSVGADTGTFTLVWDYAGTTARIKHYGGSHATKANQTEFPGDISPLSGTFNFRGTAYAAWLRAIVSDALPVASSYMKRVVFKVPSKTGALSRTLTKIMVVVGTKPVGADLQVEVRKLAAPAVGTDRFLDASSTSLTTVTLTAAGNFAVETTGLAHSLAPDDELVVKYGTVGTTTVAGDVTIILQIE